ncbi:Kelch repeat-containing protein [Hibiscus syriacus]|uniref:Kelch repeat-containing protein n=1 Tax=Hibiscus syriacus TaxID=106335 RepID=A0A6A2YUT0_HIBSY|nr:Kelch repeat-containing protein [Hibiscus syriacus]
MGSLIDLNTTEDNENPSSSSLSSFSAFVLSASSFASSFFVCWVIDVKLHVVLSICHGDLVVEFHRLCLRLRNLWGGLMMNLTLEPMEIEGLDLHFASRTQRRKGREMRGEANREAADIGNDKISIDLHGPRSLVDRTHCRYLLGFIFRFKLSSLSIPTDWSPHSSDLPATFPVKLKEPVNSSSNPKPKVLSIFRYAPATQLWRGRLHVMVGSQENKHTTGLEHWSLAVKDGKALETEWRSEVPIPRGGPHSEVFMLDGDMKWKTLPPMPKPDSHIEFAWALVNNSIVIAGGTTEKHPITKKMILVGEVFQFNFDTLEWSVIGNFLTELKPPSLDSDKAGCILHLGNETKVPMIQHLGKLSEKCGEPD